MSEQEKKRLEDMTRDAAQVTSPMMQELIQAFGAGMAAQARLEAQKRTEKEEAKC